MFDILLFHLLNFISSIGSVNYCVPAAEALRRGRALSVAPSTSTVNLSASAWRWGAGTAQVPPHGQPGGKSRLTQKMPPVAQKECEVRGGPGVPKPEGCFVKVPGFLGSLKIIIIKISQGPPSRPRGGECGASPSPRAAHADLSLQGLSSQGAHRLAGAGRGRSQHRPRK